MVTPRTAWPSKAVHGYGRALPALTRLGWRDADEVAGLLNSAWESSYGPTPRPVFDRTYLEWLYGGPAAAEHLLLGRRIEGRLVAFKALLARTVLLQGRARRAHLSTHLTVHPGLSLRDRLETLTAIVRPHSLIAGDPLGARPVDLTVAYFEADKRIVRDSEAVVDRFGLVRSQRMFPQSIVNPVALEATLAGSSAAPPGIRRATAADLPGIADLWDRVIEPLPFAVAMTPAQLHHHLFGLSSAHVFVAEAERGGRLTGVLMCYEMETVRLNRHARVIAVDYLLVDAPAAAAPLLSAALEVARAAGARGVVLENATALDEEVRRAGGIVPSARRMLLSVVARQPVPLTDRFLGDVK